MPHKWSAAYIYQDFLRVIERKYEEPQKSRFRKILRDTFEAHKYIDPEFKLTLAGRYNVLQKSKFTQIYENSQFSLPK